MALNVYKKESVFSRAIKDLGICNLIVILTPMCLDHLASDVRDTQ